MLSSSVNACVCKGRAADAEALAAVFADAWRQAYRGIIPHSHLELIIDRRGPHWWRKAARSNDGIMTLVVGDEVAGYATFGSNRTRGSKRGEIYELYVAPSHQGLGFGEYLFESCRNDLDKLKYRGLVVWALADNTIATDFYWRRGGRPFAEVDDNVGGRSVSKVGFLWP
jgi:ribosomal protein S18 acetylase RimI-like enzyme